MQTILEILVLIAVSWGLYKFLKFTADEVLARKASLERARQARQAKVEAHKARQVSYRNELSGVCDASIGTFETIPKHLLSAEELLDVAEQDFREGAFAPFWDSIEHALGKLSEFDQGVTFIESWSRRYAELVKVYEGLFTPFPITQDAVRRLGTAQVTSERLKAIVRTAQRNFQFATIYEQRKTNQLLVAGFTNLAQALDGLGNRILSSLEGLEASITNLGDVIVTSHEGLARSIAESNSEASAAIVGSIGAIDSDLRSRFEQQSEREVAALAMLDNIQRRRTPYPRKIGDGAY